MNCDTRGMFFTITRWGSCSAQVCICISVTDGSVVDHVCVCVCVCVCVLVCGWVVVEVGQTDHMCPVFWFGWRVIDQWSCGQVSSASTYVHVQVSEFYQPHAYMWFVSQCNFACSPSGRLDCCSSCCFLWPQRPSSRVVRDLWGRLPAQEEGEGHADCKWQWMVERIVHVPNHHVWLHSQDDCQFMLECLFTFECIILGIVCLLVVTDIVN